MVLEAMVLEAMALEDMVFTGMGSVAAEAAGGIEAAKGESKILVLEYLHTASSGTNSYFF